MSTFQPTPAGDYRRSDKPIPKVTGSAVVEKPNEVTVEAARAWREKQAMRSKLSR